MSWASAHQHGCLAGKTDIIHRCHLWNFELILIALSSLLPSFPSAPSHTVPLEKLSEGERDETESELCEFFWSKGMRQLQPTCPCDSPLPHQRWPGAWRQCP